MSRRSRAAVTIVSAAFLIILYVVIFSFSEQDATESGALSHRISELCVNFFNNLTSRNWTEDIIQGMTNYFEHPIRKIAHFCEYAVMGVLVYLMWRPWCGRPLWKNERKGKINLLLVIAIWVFISAAMDEFHQTFIPGRSGNLPDIFLDTAGGVFGCVFVCLIEILFLRIRFGRKAWRIY